MAGLIRFSVAARAYVLPVAVHIPMGICAFSPPVADKKVADGVDTDTKVVCKDISWGTTETQERMISMAVCNVSKQQEMAVESEWQQPVVV